MTTQKLNSIAEDKLEVLVNGPKYGVFKGVAGTGKTWLLQEKIRHIVMSWFSQGPDPEKDEKILFICGTPLLASRLRDILPDVLLKSAMDVLSKWIGKTDVKNKKRRHSILKDMDVIFKTQKPQFDHIFVDEAEDLCLYYNDLWWTSLHSLRNGGGGYFWQAYDPLYLTNTPDSLKKEVEGAHSLLTVYRNPGSVFRAWATGNFSLMRDCDLINSGIGDPWYNREEIRLGHDIQGPKVEKFRATSSCLSKKIQCILRDEFGRGTYVGDIVVLFADHGDFYVHGERLRREMQDEAGKSYTGSVAVELAGSFKGREAAIVFLIVNGKARRRNEFYLGASRCAYYLIIFEMEASKEDDKAGEKKLLEIISKLLPGDAPRESQVALENEWRRSYLMESLDEQ
ncbi:unnamed protein product [Darwinula stevensoni]|uniref:Uncharacterized protein n=1 Tax=Darwinula stevensoni TaxID=69355 RepID=A0A7R8XKS9_9CRUS|nr:unnamed protein product [Darwinula stevensoni]CAG0893475.1 unnamed protein product [Darwinula stevensoni]